MTLSEALEADRRGQIEQAATRYELLLSEGPPTLVVLLNLAVLYWQATDPGLAAAKRLTPEFLAKASSRFPELLTEAERSFPRNAEARFWRRYIRWADLGEPFSREECQQLLREDPSTLVPVMYLFDPTSGGEVTAGAHELLRRCLEENTTRARYIASAINGVLRRAGGRSQ